MQHQSLLPTIIGSNAGHGNQAPVARQPSLKLSIYKQAKVAPKCLLTPVWFLLQSSLQQEQEQIGRRRRWDSLGRTRTLLSCTHSALGLDKGQRSQLGFSVKHRRVHAREPYSRMLSVCVNASWPP